MSTAVAKREPAELIEGAQSRQLEAIKRILSQRTPPGEIRVRDGRGGQKLKYTDGAYVIRTLNEALGWDWDFVADSEELIMNGDKPFEVKVRGTLTVRMDGRVVTKTQYGCQPIEFLRDGTKPVSIGDAYKGAATDAMKKCASLLGIALDLYDSDYKPEKYAGVELREEVQEVIQDALTVAAVRQVKLESQQPTHAPGELPTNLKGQAGQVVALAKALRWNDAPLVGLIVELFGTVVMPGRLGETLEFMTGDEHRELIRVLKGKLGGKQ